MRKKCFGIVLAMGMGWLTACGGMKDATEKPEQIPTSQYTVVCEEEKEPASGENRSSEEVTMLQEASEENRSSECSESAEITKPIENNEPAEVSETIPQAGGEEVPEIPQVPEETGAREENPLWIPSQEEQATVLKPEEPQKSQVPEKSVETLINTEETETKPAETVMAETVMAETVTAETVTAETVTAETVTAETVTAETAPREVKPSEHVHDFYESWWTYPDCINGGYYYIRCRGCDYVETGKDAAKLAPLGHRSDEGVVVKAPTCLHTGVREHHCIVCGAALADSVIPADPTAHVWMEDDLGVYCDICNQEG